MRRRRVCLKKEEENIDTLMRWQSDFVIRLEIKEGMGGPFSRGKKKLWLKGRVSEEKGNWRKKGRVREKKADGPVSERGGVKKGKRGETSTREVR